MRAADDLDERVIPFDSRDERFLDYLIDEAIRAWAAANLKG